MKMHTKKYENCKKKYSRLQAAIGEYVLKLVNRTSMSLDHNQRHASNCIRKQ